jgi:hypothetical protein
LANALDVCYLRDPRMFTVDIVESDGGPTGQGVDWSVIDPGEGFDH